jgi:hypothetical protein
MFDNSKRAGTHRCAQAPGIEKLCDFFDAKRKNLRAPEILTNFGRRTDQKCGSRHQYAHWRHDPAPGVHAAGSD